MRTPTAIGPVGATALAASITDPHQFRSGPAGRRLVGIDAASEVERRQRAARAHHQNGRTNTCASPVGLGAAAGRASHLVRRVSITISGTPVK